MIICKNLEETNIANIQVTDLEFERNRSTKNDQETSMWSTRRFAPKELDGGNGIVRFACQTCQSGRGKGLTSEFFTGNSKVHSRPAGVKSISWHLRKLARILALSLGIPRSHRLKDFWWRCARRTSAVRLLVCSQNAGGTTTLASRSTETFGCAEVRGGYPSWIDAFIKHHQISGPSRQGGVTALTIFFSLGFRTMPSLAQHTMSYQAEK
jgi:hypothetical protein